MAQTPVKNPLRGGGLEFGREGFEVGAGDFALVLGDFELGLGQVVDLAALDAVGMDGVEGLAAGLAALDAVGDGAVGFFNHAQRVAGMPGLTSRGSLAGRAQAFGGGLGKAVGGGGEIQGFPSIDEDVETAEIEGGVEFDGVGLKGGFAGKGGSDELADFGRELGDVADGAGAGAIGGAACLWEIVCLARAYPSRKPCSLRPLGHHRCASFAVPRVLRFA